MNADEEAGEAEAAAATERDDGGCESFSADDRMEVDTDHPGNLDSGATAAAAAAGIIGGWVAGQGRCSISSARMQGVPRVMGITS